MKPFLPAGITDREKTQEEKGRENKSVQHRIEMEDGQTDRQGLGQS